MHVYSLSYEEVQVMLTCNLEGGFSNEPSEISTMEILISMEKSGE